jgi:ribose transport system ATP-binding protein
MISTAHTELTVDRLFVSNVSKKFGHAQVLRDITLTIRPGEVHALLGQNGSGKSTLIKILSGAYQAEFGATITVDGEQVLEHITPLSMAARGMTFVHQTLGLIPGLSVAENIRSASLSRRGRFGLIRWRHERALAEATLSRLHSDIDPSSNVDELTLGQRAIVAIARALQSIKPGRGCVVLDESTQSLPRESLPEFFDTLRGLAGAGTSVLIVSHRLDEVLAIADTATVLRDGTVSAAAVPTAGLDEAALARAVLGRELTGWHHEPRPAKLTGAPLRLRVARSGPLHDVDLRVCPGEIVGITGAAGSGYDEIPALFTRRRRRRDAVGVLELGTHVIPIDRLDIIRAATAGIAVVPAERTRDGLALGLSARDNLTLPRVGRGVRWLRSGWQQREFTSAVTQLGLTPVDPHLSVSQFSGGNQQKILLAKWLLHHPDVLVLHEPTQAVDIGARADILRAVRKAARAGARVLLCSIEAHDLALVCDRVVVFGAGTPRRELRAPFDADDILHTPSLTMPEGDER